MHTERLTRARRLTAPPSLALLASLALAALAGCSHAEEAKFPAGTTDPPPSVARPAAPIPALGPPTAEELSLRGEEQGASRPRLSRTLRLGIDESVYASPSAAAAGPGASGVTVIVNNNISQHQQTVVSTGGYGRGGYGYGSGLSPYGTAGGYTGSRSFGTSPGPSPLPQPQAPSVVPRVGGDWAPPRNYGPPAMR